MMLGASFTFFFAVFVALTTKSPPNETATLS
jgi:hypothetical protein